MAADREEARSAAWRRLVCRIVGHKFKAGGSRQGMTEREGTRTRAYNWCWRCERYIPGFVYLRDVRRFPDV